MAQKDFVIAAFEKLGGMATLNQLYGVVDISSWGTKTPFASIRRIVQNGAEFYKIQPGLWALKDYENKISAKFGKDSLKSESEFSHSYFQGIIASIGNARNFTTFIPAQDKNKLFINQKLSDIATLDKIYEFSYPKIIQKAKSIDVVWFNERELPNAFFEVEHSTDIKNSLNKFHELQDFRAKFFIVAKKERKRQFEALLQNSIYKDIKKFVEFADYESIIQQYEKETIKIEMGI